MSKILYFLAILVALLSGAFFLFQDSLYPEVSFENIPFERLADRSIREVGEIAETIIEEVEEFSNELPDKEIFVPGPLVDDDETFDPQFQLTITGILDETNKRRLAEGFTPLVLNTELTVAAQNKAEDMFALQYFEHDSPTGVGISELISAAGYEYIAVAENLALGNYKDDAAVVDAWMNSPGHRANILNGTFTQIGISAVPGVFKGQSTWMAVQEFGLPLSACPTVEKSLLLQIETDEAFVRALEKTLLDKKQELESTSKQDSGYNEKVIEYNSLVEEYNLEVAELRQDIARYNESVAVFNACTKNL